MFYVPSRPNSNNLIFPKIQQPKYQVLNYQYNPSLNQINYWNLNSNNNIIQTNDYNNNISNLLGYNINSNTYSNNDINLANYNNNDTFLYGNNINNNPTPTINYINNYTGNNFITDTTTNNNNLINSNAKNEYEQEILSYLDNYNNKYIHNEIPINYNNHYNQINIKKKSNNSENVHVNKFPKNNFNNFIRKSDGYRNASVDRVLNRQKNKQIKQYEDNRHSLIGYGANNNYAPINYLNSTENNINNGTNFDYLTSTEYNGNIYPTQNNNNFINIDNTQNTTNIEDYNKNFQTQGNNNKILDQNIFNYNPSSTDQILSYYGTNEESKAKVIKIKGNDENIKLPIETIPSNPNKETDYFKNNNFYGNTITSEGETIIYEGDTITTNQNPVEEIKIPENKNNNQNEKNKNPEDKSTIGKETTNKNNNQTPDNSNQNVAINKNQNHFINIQNIYYFNLRGLYNIGSTCYMNSVLQCLLHTSELINYFLNQYPKDYDLLKEKNKEVPTKGDISKVFYDLIKKYYTSVAPNNNLNTNKNILKFKTFTPQNEIISKVGFGNPLSPEVFQRVIGHYNSQFINLEANDSKDLILYLLQSMHSELNYYTDNIPLKGRPNQYDRVNTFHYFINTYDILNYSIISQLFYGTYENKTKCKKCQFVLFNFQKFEFMSFGVSDYDGKKFNIYNGFEDFQKVQELKGDNQFYCNYCKKLEDAEISSEIIFPPNKLLINIDYGKYKKYNPESVKFDEVIDITKYVSFNFGMQIKYRIIGVCTHFGESGIYGHYIAFCRNRNTGKWYVFNDSSFKECHSNSIYSGTPYLLLYEKII